MAICVQLLSDESGLLIIIKLTGSSDGSFQQLGFLKPSRSSQRMFRFTITHKRSSCLKINGARVTLIKAFSSERFSGRGRMDQRGLWSGSFRRGEAVCLRRWWTSWWELEWRRRANTSVSDSYWTSGQEETLVNHITRAADLQRCERHAHLCSYTPSVLRKHEGFLWLQKGLGPQTDGRCMGLYLKYKLLLWWRTIEYRLLL